MNNFPHPTEYKNYTIAITGASGSIYALKLIEFLLQNKYSINLILSRNAYTVLPIETQIKTSPNKNFTENKKIIEDYFSNILTQDKPQINTNTNIFEEDNTNITEYLKIHAHDNIAASCASGSYRTQAMIILPASMGCIGRIATGISSDLVSRVADVCLKESFPLLICPRETPLNSIHLQNLLTLSQAGAKIIPPMPAFYHNPQTLDDIVNHTVGKILDMLNISHSLFQRWGVTS